MSASKTETEGILATLQAINQDSNTSNTTGKDSRENGRRLLLNHVRQHVATVLGLDIALLTDSHSGFTDLGIDSLTAVELRNRLQTSLEQPFPVTLIYDYPTLAALTDYLLNLLMPDEASASTPSAPSPPNHDALPLSAEAIANLNEDDAEAQLIEELKRLEH